jgi:hypothetical protein
MLFVLENPDLIDEDMFSSPLNPILKPQALPRPLLPKHLVECRSKPDSRRAHIEGSLLVIDDNNLLSLLYPNLLFERKFLLVI